MTCFLHLTLGGHGWTKMVRKGLKFILLTLKSNIQFLVLTINYYFFVVFRWFSVYFELLTLSDKRGRSWCLSGGRWPEKATKRKYFWLFSEFQPFYIMPEPTTGGLTRAHMPIKQKTDSKGIKMTPLAAPNQILCQPEKSNGRCRRAYGSRWKFNIVWVFFCSFMNLFSQNM